MQGPDTERVVYGPCVDRMHFCRAVAMQIYHYLLLKISFVMADMTQITSFKLPSKVLKKHETAWVFSLT